MSHDTGEQSLQMNCAMPKQSVGKGVFPTMITPFTADGAIDWAGVDGLVEWYIASGVTGIFAVCQSSEMYHLTEDERLELGLQREDPTKRPSVRSNRL